MFFSRKVKFAFIAVVILAIIAIVVALLVVYLPKDASNQVFTKAAVVTNGAECAEIGRNILAKNGSVGDAAIAALLCEGIACSQSAGLGGGFLSTIYTHSTGKVRVLNARERAPAAATPDMFKGGEISSIEGGLAVAVPGELRGYEELYKMYGKLPWKELVQPSIELCRNGHLVTDYLARVLSEKEDKIKAQPSLSKIFVNPATNKVWVEGDKIKRIKLAETLEIIAKEGPGALHNGTLTASFVADIKKNGGIITEDDMRNYKVEWQEPLVIDLDDDLVLHTVPLPGSGHLLAFILNMFRGWVVKSSQIPSFDVPATDSVTYWHRIVEIFKYAYARRTSLGEAPPPNTINPLLANLTSMNYAKETRNLIQDNKTHNDWKHYGAKFDLIEDHGTAHISIRAPNGDAIAVTATINFIFGAFFSSESTGIILNNEMDDFSYPNITSVYDLPPSPANFLRPGSHPLSSMCPSVAVGGSGARFIVGAAGGTKITSQVALTILKHLLSEVPIQDAINMPRLHHQLFPMVIQHENDFDKGVLKGLATIGHNLSELSPTTGFAAVTAIGMDKTGNLVPRFDKRRPGSYAGF